MADQSNYDEESLASTLPKDAMVQILVRLPVKVLLRFRSVSKSWYSILKSPTFIKLHLNHQLSRPAPTLILQNRDNLAFPDLALLHLNNDYGLLKLPSPFTIETEHFAKFEFSYNGLICLVNNVYTKPEVILWNPATKKYKCINVPSECTRFTYMRLGYVQESNDYKLLKVPFETIWCKFEVAYLAWVYTFSSGSWKTVPFTLLSQTVAYGPEISLNDLVYWLATSNVECIICFDLIKDEFKLLDVPDDRGFHRTYVHRKLMVLRGSLAMMVSVDDGFKDTEIWVMKTSYNNGIQQNSWTKKFIIEPFSKDTIPSGIWDADKLLVMVRTFMLKQVYTYDLVTKVIDYFHVPDEQEVAPYLSVCGRYFESLVELGDK